jgi:hypothetical protein
MEPVMINHTHHKGHLMTCIALFVGVILLIGIQASSPVLSRAAIGECPKAANQLYLPLVIRGGGDGTPNFALGLASSCLMVAQGYAGTVQVMVTPRNGFNSTVNLSLEGAPSGVAGTFNPSSVSASGTSTLNLSVGSSANTNTYSLVVKGTSGNLVQTVTFTFIVVQPLVISGSIEFDTGGAVAGAQVSVRTEDGQATANAVSGANGTYTVQFGALLLPVKILAEATYAQSGQPTLTNSKWNTFTTRGSVQMPRILLPNPSGAQVNLSGGTGQTADGSVRVTNVPTGVAQLFARSYDPGVSPDAFPGEFAESGKIPLKSSEFLWMQALGTTGNRVKNLSQAVTIRSVIPKSQWADLEDINIGTDRIEIPIYTFNETTRMWDQMGVGWLEDGLGTVLPEDAQSVILDGSFSGNLFATFTTTHLSYMNVDYPYIGPWTLSRMQGSDQIAKRNNDCFYNAMQLAKTIARSAKGRESLGFIGNFRDTPKR